VDASLDVYEKSLDEAAKKVLARLNAGDPLRMMWVSGPSSSGKTTTTVKLTERLQKHGLRFLMLNLDDYFWSLVEHPTDWINDRNFEPAVGMLSSRSPESSTTTSSSCQYSSAFS